MNTATLIVFETIPPSPDVMEIFDSIRRVQDRIDDLYRPRPDKLDAITTASLP